ncbi:MAG: hypothetical protein B7Z66_09365 [Chromatiales bacterium 21-64-14]|nr:MAG: hypothetical protein B7Z66_09365 [Chromatiales bacterium 21-64-14]HQU16184.1 transposase [Gammaproteobacteria bacterium]
MPRRVRMYIAGLPYHVVQRGNNRGACFQGPDDYRAYLDLWRRMARRYGVAVHAYCLMTNHVHFLVTPTVEDAVSRAMKVVGSCYARYVNLRYRRTGTLWEGRHRSSLVDSERYLLCCYRYIELNPVRAGMVRRPGEYRWSSYGFNAWGEGDWLEPHEVYGRLGGTADLRRHAYRALFERPLRQADLDLIRKAAHYCQPVGDDRFQLRIAHRYGITAGQMRRGRPRKQPRAG